jgi:dihydropyrimidine dehydrogenase (NAD+) subunit PreT
MASEKKFNEMMLTEETARCLLCYDAPCSKACPLKASPADFIRSIRFRNLRGAMETAYKKGEYSVNCVKICEGNYCERACLRAKIDEPIRVKAIHEHLVYRAEAEEVFKSFKAIKTIKKEKEEDAI